MKYLSIWPLTMHACYFFLCLVALNVAYFCFFLLWTDFQTDLNLFSLSFFLSLSILLLFSSFPLSLVEFPWLRLNAFILPGLICDLKWCKLLMLPLLFITFDLKIHMSVAWLDIASVPVCKILFLLPALSRSLFPHLTLLYLLLIVLFVHCDFFLSLSFSLISHNCACFSINLSIKTG